MINVFNLYKGEVVRSKAHTSFKSGIHASKMVNGRVQGLISLLDGDGS